MRAAVFRRARGACERAISEPLRRRTVDATGSLSSVLKTVRNDAVESAARRRSGSQITRSVRAA
eukprot:7359725-Lingulodinium_polyedra.AAC.1